MIREERKKKKKVKRILIALLIVLLLAAVLALVVVKVFRVKNVEVEGNELYGADVIEQTVLNDEYSWNSLYVFLKYRFIETDEVPFIDEMEITLKNPQTLHVKVYEKGMMGYLYIPSIDENAYFDNDGFVVETSADKIEDVTQLVGIDCSEVVLYEKLPIEEGVLREILTLTQALKRCGRIPDSVTYGVANEPVLKYGGIQVEMGDLSLLTQKVERLDKIMPHLKGKQGTLHLENWTEETTNIVFQQNQNKKKNSKKNKN